jgi:hypothetical protein
MPRLNLFDLRIALRIVGDYQLAPVRFSPSVILLLWVGLIIEVLYWNAVERFARASQIVVQDLVEAVSVCLWIAGLVLVHGR